MSENSGPAKPVAGPTEYSFYQNVTYGVTPYGLLNPSQQTLYGVLKQKVAYGGLDALNKKAMQSIGQVRDKNNSLTYQSSGERINPVIVSSIQDIKDRVGSASLVTTDHGREGNVKLPAGMYRDTGQNRYYLVLDTKQKQSKAPPLIGSSPTTSYQLDPLKPVVEPFVGTKTSFPKSKPAKPPKDDLIFNSADYQSTYEEAITQMSLALIASGDDIISNYSYESIDSLPDYDVEIEISGGEYLNAREVIEKGLLGGEFQSLIDNSTSSEELEKANKLLEYLEGKIGIDVSYSEILKYFGSFNADNVTFNSGVRKKTSDSPDADFYIEIPDEYQIAGVNEVRIRFDLI
jgi:hypothetical protein